MFLEEREESTIIYGRSQGRSLLAVKLNTKHSCIISQFQNYKYFQFHPKGCSNNVSNSTQRKHC